MPTLSVNGVDLAYDEAGDGPPLLLIHAGIVDRRMWDEVMPAFAERYRTIRFDLRGYGETPLPDGPFVYGADARGLLHSLGVDRAHVVAVSIGGHVALDMAIAHPELIDRLVVVSPGLAGWEMSDELKAGWSEEEAAFDRGDLDEAAWISVEIWLDGPDRDPDDLPAELRERVWAMQRRAYDHDNDAADGGWLVADRHLKLRQITAPTLVAVGEYDQPDFEDIGRHIARSIPGARFELLPRVAHLPPLERPADFSRLVLDFLGE